MPFQDLIWFFNVETPLNDSCEQLITTATITTLVILCQKTNSANDMVSLHLRYKFVGFSVASESSLEILTDILDDFTTKLCRLLRMSVDNNALGGRTGFPVSQTLASKSKLLFMFATVLFVF